MRRLQGKAPAYPANSSDNCALREEKGKEYQATVDKMIADCECGDKCRIHPAVSGAEKHALLHHGHPMRCRFERRHGHSLSSAAIPQRLELAVCAHSDCF
jgi:hypothetical protein